MAHHRFNKENVLVLYRLLVRETGGTFGVRDEGLLDSAITAPFQSFDDKELYPTVIAKAARLGYGIISNHPFVDGNKRMGVLLMLTYLESENLKLIYTPDELVELGVGLAAGQISYEDLVLWIKNHI